MKDLIWKYLDKHGEQLGQIKESAQDYKGEFFKKVKMIGQFYASY